MKHNHAIARQEQEHRIKLKIKLRDGGALTGCGQGQLDRYKVRTLFTAG